MSDREPLVSLPEALRSELKEPLGPIEQDVALVLESTDGPIFAVGDVVTYHLVTAGHEPAVALIDELTKRSPVADEISDRLTTDPWRTVHNPAATLTEELLTALVDALERSAPTTILVEGEEDLAVLPLIAMAPDDATVVYGQPDEGMVIVTVTEDVRSQVRSLLERFDGDVDRLGTVLDEGAGGD